MSETITAYFDGSCKKNPGGKIGYGALINNSISLWGGDNEHSLNSNNTAEHRALNLIFDWIDKKDIKNCDVKIFGDSEVVILQMVGSYRIKKDRLYYQDGINNINARDFLTKHNSIRFFFKWIPREQNTACDDLSNLFYSKGK